MLTYESRRVFFFMFSFSEVQLALLLRVLRIFPGGQKNAIR